MDLTSFLFPILLIGITGVIGITFWLAWIIFKIRYKDKLVSPPMPVIPSLAAREPEDTPFLKLTRTPFGEWEIFVDGQYYRTIEAVPGETVRQDIVAGLKALAAFARSHIQKTQTAKQPRPTPGAEPVTPEQSVAPDTLPFAAKGTDPPLASKQARVFLTGEPELKRPAAPPTLMPIIDLAREIGDIVNEMQMRIPSLSGRSIRLQNAPGGGIQFAIDGIVYPDVDAIPDLDIQALIRAATQEWERR